MKNAMKPIIILGMIFFLLGTMGGCKGKSEEVGEDERAISGKYLNQDDFDAYIELKDDGVAYRKKKDELYGGYEEMACKWRIDDGELLLINVFGDVYRYKIKGDTIYSADGTIWKKQEGSQEEKKTSLSKKISEAETRKQKLSKRKSSAVAKERTERTPTLPSPTQQTRRDEEKLSKPPPSATPSLDEKEKLSQQINTKLEAYSNKDSFPLPPISLTLRTTALDLVEKVETIYFTALDYQFFSLRSLRFAKDFLNKGEIAKSKKYIEKADRYYKLATSLQRDSFSVLDSTYSAAQWMVAYKASRTALGFTATGLGIGTSTLFDLGTLYTDYSLDKSTMPLEEAKKNLIAKAISNILLQSTGTSDLVGDSVKQGWGSSRAFPVLQKIMGSSEFKDAALRELMRLGGDVGDYVAKETIEEVLASIIKGDIEEEPDKKIVEESSSLPTREEIPPKSESEPESRSMGRRTRQVK